VSLPKISTRGEIQDLDLKQGATLRVQHTLTNAAGTAPFDLTGCQVRGQVRKTPLATTVVQSFQAQVETPATAGIYTFWLTDEQTAAIPCGEKPGDDASQYVYDIEIEEPGGDVRCVLEGKISVIAGVTR
jgi:hypothetical protein